MAVHNFLTNRLLALKVLLLEKVRWEWKLQGHLDQVPTNLAQFDLNEFKRILFDILTSKINFINILSQKNQIFFIRIYKQLYRQNYNFKNNNYVKLQISHFYIM